MRLKDQQSYQTWKEARLKRARVVSSSNHFDQEENQENQQEQYTNDQREDRYQEDDHQALVRYSSNRLESFSSDRLESFESASVMAAYVENTF